VTLYGVPVHVKHGYEHVLAKCSSPKMGQVLELLLDTMHLHPCWGTLICFTISVSLLLCLCAYWVWYDQSRVSEGRGSLLKAKP